MGIIDDVVVNAKSAAEAVGKKAEQIVDLSKLRANAAEVNSEITRRYQVLGQFIYENCREELGENVEVTGKISELDALREQQEVIAKTLIEKQNKALCPTCGKLSPSAATYCSVCGSKLGE